MQKRGRKKNIIFKMQYINMLSVFSKLVFIWIVCYQHIRLFKDCYGKYLTYKFYKNNLKKSIFARYKKNNARK